MQILKMFFFLDDNLGFVCVYHPFQNDPGTLLKTTDGGDTWKGIEVPLVPYCIRMFDRDNGILGCIGGGLYTTDDGGESWSLFGFLKATILDMSIINSEEKTSLISTAYGGVIKYTPQGIIDMDPDDDIVADVKGIHVLDENRFCCTQTGNIYYYDGIGYSDLMTHTAGYVSDICFADENRGWACNDYNLVQGTGKVDPEYAWARIKDADNAARGLNKIFAWDKDNIWIVGNTGVMYYSSNASECGYNLSTQTWWSEVVLEQQAVGMTDKDFTGVYFTSMNNGYVVGAALTILRYTILNSVDEGHDRNELLVSPNPAVDLINLSGEFLPNSKYEISDIKGNLLMNGDLPESQSINISELQAGAYFIKIMSGDEVFTEKFIVEK